MALRGGCLIAACAVFSCVSRESAPEEAPIITSATYQHTQYNGRTQAVEVSAAKDDAPPFVITYFTSEEDLEQDRNGFPDAPVDVGDYYARIERPAGNGYKQGRNIKIEYHIQKAFVSIVAEGVQRFVYDGGHKEAAVRCEPPVDLVVNYFTAGNTAPEGSRALPSPPAEKGRYRVSIVFPGNDRYMGASREIELLIE
ncbi:MAG: hypothetical protein LBF77_05140 [Spirochaetaceae bacterium]|nr:hypothetical protein [Spirochaetaceae bacterium]